MARSDSTGSTGSSGTPGGSGGTATPGGVGSGNRSSGGDRSTGGVGRGDRPASPGSRLAWIAVAIAGILTAWQVVYALTAPTTPNEETYFSVSLLLTLVLSVGAIVLGIVALGQRAQPQWPATAATAVGVFAFIVCVATWIGTLMA